MSSEAVDYDAQVAAVREAFEREFGRFARFRAYEGTEGLALDEAEALSREVKELTTRHTAKKSAVSQLMKLVGRVPAEERARFGQLVQQLDKEIRGALGDVGVALLGRISLLKTERERVDVTLPGRGPGTCTRLRSCASASRTCSSRWATRSRTAPKSRRTSTTSPRSTSRSCTRRARRRTRSTRPTA